MIATCKLILVLNWSFLVPLGPQCCTTRVTETAQGEQDRPDPTSFLVSYRTLDAHRDS